MIRASANSGAWTSFGGNVEEGLVRFVERRAQALRVPYSHSTPPQVLLEHVLQREHRLVKDGLEGQIPDCYGVMFAGPYDPLCDACHVRALRNVHSA